MIGVQLESGEYLDLFPDTVINLQLANPIYADNDIIPGSLSLPFDVPGGMDNQKNMRLLANPDVIEGVVSQRTFNNVKLYYDGVFYKTGQLQVYQPQGNKISLNFIFGLPTLANGFKNIKLATICDKAYSITGAFTKRAKITVSNPSSGTYDLTVNGHKYTGTGIPLSGITVYDSFASVINSGEPSLIATATGSYVLIKLSIANAITNAFTIEHDRATDIFIDTSDFESEYNGPIKTFLNGYLSAPADDCLRFPMMYNDGLYSSQEKYYRGEDGQPPDQFDFINYVEGYPSKSYYLNKPSLSDFGLILASGAFEPDNRTSIQPHVRLQWIFNTIAAYFNIGLEGDFLSDPDYPKAMITGSKVLDTELQFVGQTPWLYCRRDFNASEFVPDLVINDFFKDIINKFNVAIWFNEKSNSLRISKRENILTNLSYEDITKLCSPIKQSDQNTLFGQSFTDFSNGILLQGKVDDSNNAKDTADTDAYQIIGNSTEIDTDISALYQDKIIPYFFNWNSSYPSPLSVTTLPFMTRAKEDTQAFIIVFEEDRTVSDYITPTTNFSVPSCTKDIAGYGFEFNDGFAENRWLNYLRFLFNRFTVYVDVEYELRHLLYIDWEKKYRFDRVNYLLSTLDIKLTMNGIEVTGVEMFPTGVGVLPS